MNFTNLIQVKEKNILLNTAKDREALIRIIKIMQKEIDQDVFIKVFEKLKQKVHNANENGLDSLNWIIVTY